LAPQQAEKEMSDSYGNMAIGIGVGAALGAAIGQVGVGIGLGAAGALAWENLGGR
jgi:hypothetical protein